ncbi:MAG: xylose isomerase [Roseibacillus sp.]|jgi:sugar phosphate isomerase/epimerase|nr:xylose isomerase [Roseibacillus sp.]MBP34287.1 xylose isomerase [Roseibacillus sp.]MDP6207818.1 sugar phosphate isomerase/epimerase family protein [Roseibacillus sp.]MDP7306855.1 sugar phosphate isomerase/epimerase family protein [Roseibacillus sp.]HJM65114.1 sugar phosphate isomerase/epimerase family protein [Roseibacillus sp.]|tara:strand:- start:16015 stop:16887 length:873 start_codon:yes stop_codon:yes gene_type:complete
MPANCTRSQFLKLSAAATIAPWTSLLAAPESRGFQIGVCDWNLGLSANPKSLELAAQIGLDGVQVSFGPPGGKHDLRTPEARELFRKAEEKHGTRMASLGMGVLNGSPYKSHPDTEQWVADSVDAAKAAGLTVVLLAFFGKGDLKGDAKGTAEVIRRLKAVAPRAEKAGVILGLETWLDVDEHLHILDSVGSPNVQVYYDLGNSNHRGYDIYKEIRMLGRKRICEIHAKDYAGKLFGQGQVDFWEARRALDDIGYRGWIQIEGRQPFGLIDSYRHDANFLRAVFPPGPKT